MSHGRPPSHTGQCTRGSRNIRNRQHLRCCESSIRTTRAVLVCRVSPEHPRSESPAEAGVRFGLVTIRDNDPLLVIDTPLANAAFITTLNAGGWAVDQTPDTGTGIDAVKLDARPAVGGTTTFLGNLTY